MRSLLFLVLLASSVGLAAQNSNPATPASSNSQKPDSAATPPANSQPNPKLAPPRSDSVNADSLDDGPGESSSKDTQIDLSPPEDDAKKHPHSSDVLKDEGSGGDIGEVHPWDPHRAGKDIEVGDYYFKRKNYKGAEDRYREALFYKDNDAIATYRLAICLEKLDRRDEALVEYENYLRILPHGPQAGHARKAIDRLKGPSASVKPAK
jgi:tetratricopeptide (TPR) repeat protein